MPSFRLPSESLQLPFEFFAFLKGHFMSPPRMRGQSTRIGNVQPVNQSRSFGRSLRPADRTLQNRASESLRETRHEHPGRTAAGRVRTKDVRGNTVAPNTVRPDQAGVQSTDVAGLVASELHRRRRRSVSQTCLGRGLQSLLGHVREDADGPKSLKMFEVRRFICYSGCSNGV